MPRGTGFGDGNGDASQADDDARDATRRTVDAAEVDEQTPDVDKPVAEPPD